MPVLEKTCSRCASVSWSSAGGVSPNKECNADISQPCDTKGSVYVDGELNVGRLEF